MCRYESVRASRFSYEILGFRDQGFGFEGPGGFRDKGLG